MEQWWEEPSDDLMRMLQTRQEGLTTLEATQRLRSRQAPRARRTWASMRLVGRQVTNPIVLLLMAAALVSLVVGETVDAAIILGIVVASALLSAAQEHRAAVAMRDLRAGLTVHADVVRDGTEVEIPLNDVVTGDVVIMRSGDIVPADIRLLSADGLLVDEAAVTGEAIPVGKLLASDSTSILPSTAVFLGTHVVSGVGRGVVVAVERQTRFGAVAAAMEERDVQTSFERSLRRFGLVLARVVAVLVSALIVVVIVRGTDPVEGVLFALALAVGITPQLLPAIVALSLAIGARRMAREGVLVKRLDAIEDLGGMTVLCCDKTGTLTTGRVSVAAATDVMGEESPRVRHLAMLNACLQAGYPNAIDAALHHELGAATLPELLAEVPYDFSRRVVSVLVKDRVPLLVSKGAVASVLRSCSRMRVDSDASPVPFDPRVSQVADALMGRGYRVLAVATRDMPDATTATSEDEREMTLEGFIALVDPPAPTAPDAIAQLRALGVQLILVTGDAAAVARHICDTCGLSTARVLTGREVEGFTDEALAEAMQGVEVVAEVDPMQKARVVAALRSSGQTVGFLGDGINDAVALKGADVGLSASGATDVARHAAALVITNKDLHTVVHSVLLGRRTFANTLKYVRVTISANFGNMISLALASTFLPFLPLLPVQVLLLNVLSDVPALAIARDRVDRVDIAAPMVWRMRTLVVFMVTFGLVSSVFDLAVFAILIAGVGAGVNEFQTTWFVLSTLTECVALLVLRTWSPAWSSRPGGILVILSCVTVGMAFLLPYLPGVSTIGLVPLPGALMAVIVALAAAYALLNEAAKAIWRRSHAPRSA